MKVTNPGNAGLTKGIDLQKVLIQVRQHLCAARSGPVLFFSMDNLS